MERVRVPEDYPTMEESGYHRHIYDATSTSLRTTRFCNDERCAIMPGKTLYSPGPPPVREKDLN